MAGRQGLDMDVMWHQVLGVTEDATPDAVEERVQVLREWLKQTKVPRELRPWLRDQRTLVEAAYQAYQASLEAEGEETEEAEEEEREEEEGPDTQRRRQELRRPSFGWLRTRLGLAAVGGVVGLVALGLVLWLSGFLGGEGPGTSPATSGPQFLAQQKGRIAALEAQVAANPSDAESLFELGETYIVGEDWAKAILWFDRLLQVDPKNVHAVTDIGTANYNLGRYPEALETWQKALALAPDDAQLHHNMGYFYSFSPMPDYPKAEVHWREVLRLAPGTELADSAQAHLELIISRAGAATSTPAVPK